MTLLLYSDLNQVTLQIIIINTYMCKIRNSNKKVKVADYMFIKSYLIPKPNETELKNRLMENVEVLRSYGAVPYVLTCLFH